MRATRPDRAGPWGRHAAEEIKASLTPVARPVSSASPLQREVEALEAAVLDGLDGSPATFERQWFADASIIVTDAVLARDKSALDELDAMLRRIHRLLVMARQALGAPRSDRAVAEDMARAEGWLQVTMDFVQSAVERIAPVAIAASVAGTHSERFLRIVRDRPGINSRKLAGLLAAERVAGLPDFSGQDARPFDEGQLSKIGRKLRAQGLVFGARGSGGLAWELTPRGRLVVDQLLGSVDDADRPVDRMVIAGGNVGAQRVAATLTASKPRQLKVVRTSETLTYELAGQPAGASAEPADEAAVDEVAVASPFAVDTSMPLEAAVSTFLDQGHEPTPAGFSLDGDAVYLLQPADYALT
ncbi:MAG TPA: hypothetical protein VGD67_26435 [Pseudonocardiaceae bacterium]